MMKLKHKYIKIATITGAKKFQKSWGFFLVAQVHSNWNFILEELYRWKKLVEFGGNLELPGHSLSRKFVIVELGSSAGFICCIFFMILKSSDGSVAAVETAITTSPFLAYIVICC